MNSLLSAGAIKVYAAVMMAAGWFYLRVMHVQGADDVVEFCKMGLAALSAHYLTYADPAAEQAAQSGNTTITIPGGTSK